MRSCGNCLSDISLSIIVSRSQMARFHNLWPSNIPLNISASADPMRVLELGKPVRVAWHEARSLFFTNISHPPLPVTNYRMETAPGARTCRTINIRHGSNQSLYSVPIADDSSASAISCLVSLLQSVALLACSLDANACVPVVRHCTARLNMFSFLCLFFNVLFVWKVL